MSGKAEALKFTLSPRPPFDFDLSCRIFDGGEGLVQTYSGGIFQRLLKVDRRLLLVSIRSLGTVSRPQIAVEVLPGRLSAAQKKKIESSIASIFNFDLDLNRFYREIRGDPVMTKVTRNLHGLRSPTTTGPYEALVSSIIEQQISLKAAWSMQRRMIRAYGDSVVIRGRTYYAFPIPEKLAALSVDDLEKCGLSGRKSEYVIGVSRMILAGELDLEGMMRLPSTEIIERMMKIRGIGRWTAEMTMIRGMHKPDALPADDLGLRRLISHYYNEDRMLSGDEVRSLAARWGKWKGIAAYYLIVASISGLEVA